MKKLKFKIDLYDWKVYYLETEKKDDPKNVIKTLSSKLKKYKMQLNEKHIYQIRNNYINGGVTYTELNRRVSVIFMNISNCNITKLSVISHEVNHVVYDMNDKFKLEGAEAQAYLTGYIMKKLYNIIK